MYDEEAFTRKHGVVSGEAPALLVGTVPVSSDSTSSNCKFLGWRDFYSRIGQNRRGAKPGRVRDLWHGSSLSLEIGNKRMRGG